MDGYYCYLNDIGTVCGEEIKNNPQMYELRKSIGNVFPNTKEAHNALNKIKEVLQCQQCVVSEGE